MRSGGMDVIGIWSRSRPVANQVVWTPAKVDAEIQTGAVFAISPTFRSSTAQLSLADLGEVAGRRVAFTSDNAGFAPRTPPTVIFVGDSPAYAATTSIE